MLEIKPDKRNESHDGFDQIKSDQNVFFLNTGFYVESC